MALSSASPQIANVKDGDKSPPADLEEGEIEDGELPEEEGEGETPNPQKGKAEQQTTLVTNIRPTPKADKPDKPHDVPLGRMSRRKQLHHNTERNDIEEEWACVVEKKLKAAIGKDTTTEKVNGSPTVVAPEKPAVEDDKKNRRKKRKKKHKEEEDDDRKETKKRKKSHHWEGTEGEADKEKVREGEEGGEEDDDEMLFVRGASPIMREGFAGEESPSTKFIEKGFPFNQQGGYDETYDSYNEEESDFDAREDFNRLNQPMSDEEAPKRGLGRGAKRRQRAGGRMLPHNKRQARKDTKNKRGGIKRQQSSRNNSDREPNVCMFYMQGKCQKGDDCPYSHNACPPRKMELCKFYLMDCCAKKDKCLYMHHDFPCKFFHTGLKCFSGPRCKFSHGHLSDAMRSILLKHLETAPKELLGDFPRLSREGAAAMVYNKKNRGNKAKKIPSLFDIEVPIPAQLLAEQKETSKDQSPRRTPMPESDNEDQDGTTTPMPQSPINDGKSKGKSQRWGSDEVHGSLSRDSKEEENPLGGEDEENKLQIPKFYQETDTDSDSKKKNEKERGKLNLHRFAGYSPNPADEKNVSTETHSSDKGTNEDKDTKRKTDEKKSQNDANNGDSGAESNDAANIPLHLPKKQRELFLRIQQQQREAESSQDQSGDHDDEVDVIPEENWYSSDDEEDSLTNVLKNLSKQDQQMASQADASTSSAVETDAKQSAVTPPLPLKIPDLSKINIDESVTKLLSSICGKGGQVPSSVPSERSTASAVSTSEQPAVQAAGSGVGVARDPRLARDPRSRSQAAGSTASSSISVFASALETATTNSATVTSTPPVTSTATATSTSTPTATSSAAPTSTSTSTAATATATSTTSTSSSSSYDSARRTDPRRIHDPRAKSSHKSEQDHKHGASVSSRRSSSHSAPTFTSIYSNAIMGDKNTTHSGLGLSIGGTGDVDLRSFLPRTLETGDVDLRNRGDTDLRTGQPPTALSFGDTDLRVRSHDLLGIGQIDSGRNNSDVDLRMLELPFKPVPMHTPATEIEASLTSHPPIPYKVVVVTIPRPDYTSLKLNTSDPQVQSDPRLRKIFKIQSPGPENPLRNSLLGSIMPVSRNDPRRLSSRGSSTSSGSSSSNSGSVNPSAAPISTEHHENVSESYPGPQSSNIKSANEMSNTTALLPNPGMRPMTTQSSSPLLPNPSPRIARDPRSAPGLLGPAPLPPNYCPNTPMFDEQSDMASGMDGDARAMFSRGSMDGARWDQQAQAPAHMSRNNWRNSRRNQQSSDQR